MHDSTRKQEFLDAALDLFYVKGYDKTTVNDIIGKLNASKGAFYHYFQSKEDVLEAVTKRYVEPEIRITQEIAKDSRLNAREKMNKIVNDVLAYKAFNMGERQKISQVFEHAGNIQFLHKIVGNKIKMLHLPYLDIIEQGIREGSFTTAFLEEATEQVMYMIIILNKTVIKLASEIGEKPDNIEIIKRKIEAYQVAIEKILGAEKGSINLSWGHSSEGGVSHFL